MSDEVTVLVGGINGIPGSREYACSVCEAKVWLAPSGQRLIASNPSVAVVCLTCAKKQMEESDEVSIGVMPDALKELSAWRKRN